MSEVRGIEIHNGYVAFPEGMTQDVHLGTEASPITQGVINQIVVSAVVNAIALGGTVEAGLLLVVGSVDLTGDLRGLRVGTIINDAITVTGSSWGINIKQQILGTGIVSTWEGIRLEMTASAGSEILGGIYGIFISNFIEGTITATAYHFIRVQENSTAKIRSVLYARTGPNGADYCFWLHSENEAWRPLGSPTNQSGYIKCMIGGVECYIRLWRTLP